MAALKHVEVDINAKLEDNKALHDEHTGKGEHWSAELQKVNAEWERQIAEARVDDVVPEALTEEQLVTFAVEQQTEISSLLELWQMQLQVF